MGVEDRNCLVILKRWAQNQDFLRADVTFCLITESLAALNQGWCRTPASPPSRSRCRTKQERLEFIRAQIGGDAAAARVPTSPPEMLAKLGAGLKRVQLQNLIAHACENRQPLTIAVPDPAEEGADRGRIGRSAGVRAEPLRPLDGGRPRGRQEEAAAMPRQRSARALRRAAHGLRDLRPGRHRARRFSPPASPARSASPP